MARYIRITTSEAPRTTLSQTRKRKVNQHSITRYVDSYLNIRTQIALNINVETVFYSSERVVRSLYR